MGALLCKESDTKAKLNQNKEPTKYVFHLTEPDFYPIIAPT
jgi:hypothetical protein